MAQLYKVGKTYYAEISAGKFAAVPSESAAKQAGIDLGDAKIMNANWKPKTTTAWNLGKAQKAWGGAPVVTPSPAAARAVSTGDPTLDSVLNQSQQYLNQLIANGQNINPNVEITEEKAAEFLAQAQREIDPYYATQMSLARESLLSSIGYSKADILAKEQKYERQYGQNLRTLSSQMAESGMAYSGERTRSEQELAVSTQASLDAARRALAESTGQAARTYAQAWGGKNIPTAPTISATPQVTAGIGTFGRSGRELPLYELPSDIYSSLIGEQEYQKQAAVKGRQAELEQGYRTQQETKASRKLNL